MPNAPQFETRWATTPEEIAAAQRLRYEVFVAELGGTGKMVDHTRRLERDRFDPYADHLLLIDHARPDAGVVGVYRLIKRAHAEAAGGWYTGQEFDLSPLLAAHRNVLELGRSCLHPDYRGGAGMMHLWQGLSAYVLREGIDVLFGVASFHGTDPQALAEPLSLLHHRHLAPSQIRPKALPPHGISVDLMPEDQIDRPAAMRRVPALIKAYLRMGGCVGEGAWIDHAFNTIDVCLIMDTANLSQTHRAIYAREAAR